MHSRQRYQHGCLTRKRRARGEHVWEFRYYETTSEGQRQRRSVTVGTVARYPTRADAMRQVEPLRLRLNVESRLGGPVTINALVERYIGHELPERHSTARSYLTVLNRWIRPRWGGYTLDEVKTVAVEQWLRELQLAPKSKTHRSLLTELAEPYHTMVLVAVCLGLRVSEIIGLQWGDFDWENRNVFVQRAVVQTRVGETKTEGSSRPLPLDPVLAMHLQELRKHSSWSAAGDWVFANDKGLPRWQETILQRQLKPAAVRAGIGKVGWHTFRHTYSTMLRSAGTDIKVQQELLRHANVQTTMNIYTQAVSDQKRAANSKVVEMVLPRPLVKAESQDMESQRASGTNGSERESAATPLQFSRSASSD